ncbi:MAG: cell division protein ZapA, partial [Ruminococcus sp.]|nr:cell division protein ZapA [Ruminococcus sp.]
MLNDVKVIICGKEYKLKTSESPNYVFALARTLETKVNDIMNSGSGSSPYTASIMVALSALDDLSKANQHLDN